MVLVYPCDSLILCVMAEKDTLYCNIIRTICCCFRILATHNYNSDEKLTAAVKAVAKK